MTNTETAAQWGTLVGVFLVAVMTQWHAWKSRKQANSAVAEARGYVAKQTQRMGEIHSLVNGAMARALRTIMILAKEKADVTGHPTDIAAAEQAQRDYEEHDMKQRLAEASRESYKAGQDAERIKYLQTKYPPQAIFNTIPATEVKVVPPDPPDSQGGL